MSSFTNDVISPITIWIKMKIITNNFKIIVKLSMNKSIQLFFNFNSNLRGVG